MPGACSTCSHHMCQEQQPELLPGIKTYKIRGRCATTCARNSSLSCCPESRHTRLEAGAPCTWMGRGVSGRILGQGMLGGP